MQSDLVRTRNSPRTKAPVSGGAAATLLLLAPTAADENLQHASIAPIDLTNILLGLWIVLVVLIAVLRVFRGMREKRTANRGEMKASDELEQLLTDAGISLHSGRGEELKDEEEHQEL